MWIIRKKACLKDKPTVEYWVEFTTRQQLECCPASFATQSLETRSRQPVYSTQNCECVRCWRGSHYHKSSRTICDRDQNEIKWSKRPFVVSQALKKVLNWAIKHLTKVTYKQNDKLQGFFVSTSNNQDILKTKSNNQGTFLSIEILDHSHKWSCNIYSSDYPLDVAFERYHTWQIL